MCLTCIYKSGGKKLQNCLHKLFPDSGTIDTIWIENEIQASVVVGFSSSLSVSDHIKNILSSIFIAVGPLPSLCYWLDKAFHPTKLISPCTQSISSTIFLIFSFTNKVALQQRVPSDEAQEVLVFVRF